MTGMTCWSCEHWRREGCFIGHSGWPSIGTSCAEFKYEPGSDESERECESAVLGLRCDLSEPIIGGGDGS